jgi:hypothetical protein
MIQLGVAARDPDGQLVEINTEGTGKPTQHRGQAQDPTAASDVEQSRPCSRDHERL